MFTVCIVLPLNGKGVSRLYIYIYIYLYTSKVQWLDMSHTSYSLAVSPNYVVSGSHLLLYWDTGA